MCLLGEFVIGGERKEGRLASRKLRGPAGRGKSMTVRDRSDEWLTPRRPAGNSFAIGHKTD